MSNPLPAVYAQMFQEAMDRLAYRLELSPDTAHQLTLLLAGERVFSAMADEARNRFSAEQLAQDEIQVCGYLDKSTVNHADPKKPVVVQLKLASTPENTGLLNAMEAHSVRLVGRVRQAQLELVEAE